MGQVQSHDASREGEEVFYFVSRDKLKPGDYICCFRGPKCFNRHGIYIGENGRKVIHFVGTTKKLSDVRSCTLNDFLGGGQLHLVTSDDSVGATFHDVSGRDLKPGDHIYCHRNPALDDCYGIYIGESDCEVILFQKTAMKFSDPPRIRSRTLDNFLEGGQLRLVARGAPDHDDSRERVGTFFHDVSRDELKPGDHIYCYRKLGIYNHHGIYIGEDGCEVIHFHGRTKKYSDPPQIRSCTLDDFLDKAQLRLVAYDASFLEARLKRSETTHVQASDPAPTVIERAKFYMRNPKEWKDYNLFSNNCESFAVYCKTETSISKQTMGGFLVDLVSHFLKE